MMINLLLMLQHFNSELNSIFETKEVGNPPPALHSCMFHSLHFFSVMKQDWILNSKGVKIITAVDSL